MFSLKNFSCPELESFSDCSSSKACVIPPECYRGEIKGIDILTMAGGTPGNTYGAAYVRESEMSRDKLSATALQLKSSGRLGEGVLNPHKEPRSILTLIVIAVSAVGVSFLAFKESSKHVRNIILFGGQFRRRSAMLPFLGFLLLVVFESAALIYGVVNERHLKGWRGIDITGLYQVSNAIPPGTSEAESFRAFSIYILTKQISKAESLYVPYLTILIIYFITLCGAILATAFVAEKDYRTFSENSVIPSGGSMLAEKAGGHLGSISKASILEVP